MDPNYTSRVPPSVLRGHVIMGALQISLGCLAILLGSISFAIDVRASHSLVGTGVWTGPFFIIAGVTGLIAGKGARCCSLICFITCLVFCILASCLGLAAMILEAYLVYKNRDIFKSNKLNDFSSIFSVHSIIICGVLISIACGLEFVLAIVHSVFACRASCCCVPSRAPQNSQQQQLQHQVACSDQQVIFKTELRSSQRPENR